MMPQPLRLEDKVPAKCTCFLRQTSLVLMLRLVAAAKAKKARLSKFRAGLCRGRTHLITPGSRADGHMGISSVGLDYIERH